jgi:glycosyltransferase involved in cell wall biosynthesis
MSAQPSDSTSVSVSVVIATFNRPDVCRGAVESVLAQRPLPLEVLVCDDGSPGPAAAALREWCATLDRVEFIGLPHRGTPAPARNAGLRAARGDWVAFLDDDDRWVPGKLALQSAQAAGGHWDVVSGDALRPKGDRYFTEETRPSREPAPVEIDAANPVILSTALARRELVLACGGFPEQRKYAGIEDYALWLALADRGARFLVLDEPLARYEDLGAERLSSAGLRLQRGLAELAARRWLSAPWKRSRANAAIRESRAYARARKTK